MGKKTRWNSKVLLFLGTIAVGMISGCAPQNQEDRVTDANLVRRGALDLVRTIGDEKIQYSIIADGALEQKFERGELKRPRKGQASRSAAKPAKRRRMGSELAVGKKPDPAKLNFGMPVGMFKKPMLFGSVITKVSARDSKEFGNLKMADFPSFRVYPVLAQTKANESFVVLMMCGADCKDESKMKPLLKLPVTALDEPNSLVYVDLASLGSELDLAEIRKSDPTLRKYQSKSSLTTRFDYSMSTLVFDVEAQLTMSSSKNEEESSAEEPPSVTIVNRWYLRSEADLNPSFVQRRSTPGVGFFLTKRDKGLVQRWDFDKRDPSMGVKYYIKNVPTQFQKSFADSFEEWNQKLRPIMGRDFFSYEFIPEGDPRNELIVAGDVRYNVLEWDLDNVASYGGLGPSLANQYSGEIFHANVMIQGPAVVKMYSDWFDANARAEQLRRLGRAADAEQLLVEQHDVWIDQINELKDQRFELRFGEGLDMAIRSQEPSLEDPLAAPEGFDPIPAGYDYDRYMTGYFRDMVAHELGHNIGLRHNFKGNLGATPGAPVQGGVSRSIMEYLGRGYRYLDEIGEYDLMAVAYGYKGVEPQHRDWFCTDENQADLEDPTSSAECSKDDATSDPFSYFQGRLARAVDLIVARGEKTAPVWTSKHMESQLESALVGMGTYAVSAEATSSSWTNFFGNHSGATAESKARPREPAEIKGYVLSKIREVICDPTIAVEVEAKATPTEQAKVARNVANFRKTVVQVLRPVFSASELSCSALMASLR